MKINIKTKTCIRILVFLKFISPIIAVIYLIGWLMQSVNMSIFKFMNLFLGFLPGIFNRMINVQTLLLGRIVPMGYVYTACLFAGFFYFSNIFIEKLEKIEKMEKNEELKKRIEQRQIYKKKRLQEIAEEKKQRREKLGITEEEEFDKKMFFGLFEFQLEYLDVYGKNPSELNKLKVEFSKIMTQKLAEKYPTVEFFVDDKIFFICKEFSKFGVFTKDILTLFKTFMQTGTMQAIKTGMYFSYWAEEDIKRKDEIFVILNKINELGYLNKIIVSSGVYFRFTREKDKNFFSFDPLGASKLIGALGNDVDLDIELYSITKVE